MLFESKGTPDILKQIIYENENIIQNIINERKDDVIIINIDRKIKINDKRILFKCNLTINLHFKLLNKYTGDINFMECIESNFDNCIINIYLPTFSKLENVLRTVAHELHHLYELYQIKDIFDKTKWLNSKALNDIDKMDFIKYEYVKKFRDIFYLSLPHEIRARITSLHFYLINLNTKNKNILLFNLENTIEYNYYLKLKDFDVQDYYNGFLKDFSIGEIIEIFNFFNKIMNINFKINNVDDFLKYLNKMKNYFSKLSNDYIKKIYRIINNVINDSVDNRILYDKNIFTFDELMELRKYKPEEINYKDYFV